MYVYTRVWMAYMCVGAQLFGEIQRLMSGIILAIFLCYSLMQGLSVEHRACLANEASVVIQLALEIPCLCLPRVAL